MYKHLLFCLMLIALISCKKSGSSEDLLRNAEIVNAGLMQMIVRDLRQLGAYTSEHKVAKKYFNDAQLYFTTTEKLLKAKDHSLDSVLFWQLTKSTEATSYGYNPILQKSDLTMHDSITRHSIIIYNLYSYLNELYKDFSICPPLYHIIPKAETDYEYSIYAMEEYNPVLEDIIIVGNRIKNTPGHKVTNDYKKVARILISDTSLVKKALEKYQNEYIIR